MPATGVDYCSLVHAPDCKRSRSHRQMRLFLILHTILIIMWTVVDVYTLMQMYSTNLSEDLALFSAYMDSKAGYYTIIQFQLSSKACEDKGIAKY